MTQATGDRGGYPLSHAVEAIASRGLDAAHAAHVVALRRAFEERAGAFGAEDPWFEARSRAFWDDAATRQGFADRVLAELPEPARPWASALRRAHRGLFHASYETGRLVVEDIWGGAEFVVDDVDEALRSSLDGPTGPFDARVAARLEPDRVRVGLLPGALFHPEDAEKAILAVLDAARERAMTTDAVLDALLRMELSLRSMSRVKPAYAYRAAALAR